MSNIGPYSFQNAEGGYVTVNGVRYREMVNAFLLPTILNTITRRDFVLIDHHDLLTLLKHFRYMKFLVRSPIL